MVREAGKENIKVAIVFDCGGFNENLSSLWFALWLFGLFFVALTCFGKL
jgi:hypothetical protein